RDAAGGDAQQQEGDQGRGDEREDRGQPGGPPRRGRGQQPPDPGDGGRTAGRERPVVGTGTGAGPGQGDQRGGEVAGWMAAGGPICASTASCGSAWANSGTIGKARPSAAAQVSAAWWRPRRWARSCAKAARSCPGPSAASAPDETTTRPPPPGRQ